MALYGNPYIVENDRSTVPGGQLKCSLTSGAGSASNITVTGMKAGDRIMSILNLTDLAEVDRTTLVSIAANAFKVAGSTSGKKLLVIWISV